MNIIGKTVRFVERKLSGRNRTTTELVSFHREDASAETDNQAQSMDAVLIIPKVDPHRMCRKHGNIQHNYVSIILDVKTPRQPELERSVDICAECYVENLLKTCHKAIPIPEPTKPFISE